MDYNEFAQRIKNKYPEYKDMDNKELATKIIDKYPEYKSHVTFENIDSALNEKQGIDLTPSGIARKTAIGISTPIRQLKYGENKEEAKRNAQALIDNAFKNNISVQGLGLATDVAPYFTMPQINAIKGAGLGAKAVNLGLTGAYQGGISGGLESLKQEGDLSGVGSGALVGGTIGLGLPVGGVVIDKAIMKPLKWLGNQYYTKLAQLKPKTIEQVVKPNSVALDLSEDEAQSILTNTTERIQRNYKDLLDKRGRIVNKEANKLRDLSKRVKLSDLENDITSTFDQYQGQNINPARNMTGNLEKEMIDLVNQGADDLSLQYGSKNALKTLDNTSSSNLFRDRYSSIINDLLNNARKKEAYIKAMNELNSLADELPPEMKQSFLNKVNADMEKIYYAKNTIAPIDVQKAKEQIGHMATWSDETARKYKNPIVQQVYGKLNNRLSELSPALKEANENFAQLKDFEKNEGIRKILRPGDNIDTASTALRNYNSTITKGNTNRNVQDLEEILTSEGYKPFLHSIDDVNAANELLKSPLTGINAQGQLDFAKMISRVPLRITREMNRRGIPEKIQKTNEKVSNLFQRLLPSQAAKIPVLYGQVEYNEGY